MLLNMLTCVWITCFVWYTCQSNTLRLVKITIPPNTFEQHLLYMFFQHEVRELEIDEMPTQIRVQNLCITRWTITEKEQLTKINLGIKENLQHVKISVNLEPVVTY